MPVLTSENHPVAIGVRFLHGVFRHVGHKAEQTIKRAIVLHAVSTEPGRSWLRLFFNFLVTFSPLHVP